MRKRPCILATLMAVTVLASVAPAAILAGEGFSLSTAALTASSYAFGGTALTIYAGREVDTAALVNGIDPESTESAQALSNRINGRRQALYPNQEVLLVVTPPRALNVTAGDQSLGRAIYWWNHTNCATCYWYWEFPNCSVATLFVDSVKYGSYIISDEVDTSGWVSKFTVRRGGSWAEATYGPGVLRGFKGAANGVPTKGDIVMYFFY